MKRIICICFTMILLTTSCMAGVVAEKEKSKILYAISAKSGMFNDETLTLTDVPLVVYFTGDPDRKSGNMSLKEFETSWFKGPNSFKKHSPKGTLSMYDTDWSKIAVLEIRDPRVDGDTITFNVKFVSGTIDWNLSECSLFIS